MITRIIIEHFKSIEYCDLTLGPVNIFVGPNGSGKSNIIDAISFLKDAVEHGLDYAFRERLGFESVRQWSGDDDRHPIRIQVHLCDETGRGIYQLLLSENGEGYAVSGEKAEWVPNDQDGENKVFSLDRTPEGHCLLELTDFRYGKTLNKETHFSIQGDLKALSLPPRHDGTFIIGSIGYGKKVTFLLTEYEAYSFFSDALRKAQARGHKYRVSKDGGNTYGILKSMQNGERGALAKQTVSESLARLMPNLTDVRIEELGGFLVPLFEVAEPKPGYGQAKTHTFNVAQVSDGTLRALGLLTALYHPDRPGMIALEEPEQMLHPGALAVLAEAIKESSEQSQIFITTHSPDLLDHFDPESVFAVEMVDGVTKVAGVSEGQMASVREGLFTLGEIMSMEGVMRASPPPPDTATGTDDA